MVTKETIYTTQATLLTNLKLQNTANTNGYQGNNLHNTFHYSIANIKLKNNRISGLMVSMLASSVVDRGFEHQSVQTKDNTIVIC
jgi:hypothetical protein